MQARHVGIQQGEIRKGNGVKDQQGQVASDTDITAMVKTSDSEIDDFLKGEKIGTARGSKADVDKDILRQGMEAGRNVEIHKDIYADSVSENLRIEQKQ